MYKQSNRFSRRTENKPVSRTAGRTERSRTAGSRGGNRIGKAIAGSKFNASRKFSIHDDDELNTKKTPKAEKPVVRQIPSFEDIKAQVSAWMTNDRIPGKLQAWFTADAIPEHSDWRIVKEYHGTQENLTIEAPARDMKPIELVVRVMEQLQKDHLHIFKKALRQIWFRASGDGRFALLVQVNVKGKISAHGYKTFVDFLERSCPEVISCHQIQCLPDRLFDPANAQGMKIETKCSFGSDFMPIANTGFCMHVLDWTPRIKEAWLNLPVRIKDAIHPNREDRFFEFCSGSSYVSASLAPCFKQVEALDCRESAMQSSRMNIRNLATSNMRFHRSHMDANFISKFFSKSENAEGRWTFYINLTGDDILTSEVEQTLATSRPERILLQTGNLETASREIRSFRNEGYVLRKSIPLYLEPGRGNFELLFLFVPDREGLLGQNPARAHQSRNVQRPQERLQRTKMTDIPHFVQKKPSFKQRKD